MPQKRFGQWSETENRNVFRSLLNTANEILGSRRLAGRLFHVFGPETLKPRSP